MSAISNQLKSSRVFSLSGTLTVPGDKSISHRAAILAGLANGTTHIENFLCSEDCLNTLNAMVAMGAHVEVIEEKEGYGPVTLLLTGANGLFHRPVSGVVDCGNSGTGIRLLAGIMTAQPFECILTGDESLCKRPMGRILTPLGEMGADIKAEGEKPGCAPLRTKGEWCRMLNAIDYTLPMASAQVKSCILLAGLFADGTTTVRQPAITRDHTEKLFAHFGIRCSVEGLNVSVEGGQYPVAHDLTVPGDISSAAFWMVAAAALPGAELTLVNVGLNPTRSAIIDVLKRMGADITVTIPDRQDNGEPYGNIVVKGAKLHGTSITRDEVPNLIDEIPILAVAGALAEGETVLREAKELRVKETDRILTVTTNLRKMGADVEEYEDGLVVRGGKPLHGCELDSFGDHRIAMAFLVAGLFADGETLMNNTACIATSYPGFDRDLAGVLAGK